jgi:3-oxoacyl-ACP reductase-like protein
MLGMAFTSSTEAQKKSKAKPAAQQAQKAEEPTAVETPAVAPTPAPPPTASSSGGVMDVLKKFVGQKTNLGILRKITRDYIETESENAVLTIPVSSIHSLKQITEQDENDQSVTKLEIRLFNKD